jgi:hypothetical protein
LSATAAELNSETDRLNASILALEAALKKLGIGITSWYEYEKSFSADGLSYSMESIGYTKLNGKWMLALMTRDGHEAAEEDRYEIWPLIESPRHLRIKALKHIPELLDKLNKDASAFHAKVTCGTEEVDLLTSAISSLDPEPPAQMPSSLRTPARKA